ncbi:hypothetical protein B0H13DRAFT_1933652 [Mycena leptocephala]|nr:hypothetical protein B0H13DRAFT_1933652 [Mycena leptocephala]
MRRLSAHRAISPLNHPFTDFNGSLTDSFNNSLGYLASILTPNLLHGFPAACRVAGGFYMADSLIAAAQFACFEAQTARPSQVDVLEYTWHGSGTKVKAFPSANKEFDSFLDYNEGDEDVENTSDPFHAQALEIYKNDMITGPLGGGVFDQSLTKDFQQYAVVQQAAATSKLTLKTRHKNILCKNVPKGSALSATQYEQTQGGNPNFNAAVTALQDPNACK